MNGYTKLFGSILASTIWGESKETKVLWITMLAMADKYGEVQSSIPGLATIARLTIEETEESLQRLLEPDKYSRTTDFDGRRIKAVEGGWSLLNHGKYRDKLDAEDRKLKNAEHQRQSRERKRASEIVRDSQKMSSTVSAVSTSEAASEAASESESSLKKTNTQERAAHSCAVNPSDVLIAWSRCPGLVPAHRVTAKRKTAVAARSRDSEWVANWEAGIVKAAASDFCCGSGSTGWRADLDWFLKPDTLMHLLEGKYDNRTNCHGQQDLYAGLKQFVANAEAKHDGA